MAFEPLAGQRFVEVKDDHKAIARVGVIAGLLDGPYSECLKMTLVGDNLTGPPERCPQTKCLLHSFGAEAAKNYLDRLEFVYTPKHGSWLDMAEIDLQFYSVIV